MRSPLFPLCITLFACAPSEAPEAELPRDTGPEREAEEPEPTFRFAFAVLADPHVTAPGSHADRLAAALDWIDDEAGARGITLALVAGDVAWRSGYETTFELFRSASVPVVPIVGDNEVQSGDEIPWDEAASAYLEVVDDDLDGFVRGPSPVRLEVPDVDARLMNWAFDHEGLRFLGVDWAARVMDPLLGEFADLHDVDDGTLAFLDAQLDGLGEGPLERVNLLTHHPMLFLPGGFDGLEQQRLVDVMAPHADQVAASYGGHLHIDLEQAEPDGGFHVYLTDATFDDDLRVRVVEVWGNDVRFTYEQELVDVPWP